MDIFADIINQIIQQTPLIEGVVLIGLDRIVLHISRIFKQVKAFPMFLSKYSSCCLHRSHGLSFAD